jgi:hypothetical protein
LPIAQELKDAFRASAGKLKPITIDVRNQKALRDVFTLVGYKSRAS